MINLNWVEKKITSIWTIYNYDIITIENTTFVVIFF